MLTNMDNQGINYPRPYKLTLYPQTKVAEINNSIVWNKDDVR